MNLVEQAKKIVTEADQKKFFEDIAAEVEELKKKSVPAIIVDRNAKLRTEYQGIKEQTLNIKEAKNVEDKMIRKTETK